MAESDDPELNELYIKEQKAILEDIREQAEATYTATDSMLACLSKKEEEIKRLEENKIEDNSLLDQHIKGLKDVLEQMQESYYSEKRRLYSTLLPALADQDKLVRSLTEPIEDSTYSDEPVDGEMLDLNAPCNQPCQCSRCGSTQPY